MDATSFARRMRDEPATASIAVIFYTAYFCQPEPSAGAGGRRRPGARQAFGQRPDPAGGARRARPRVRYRPRRSPPASSIAYHLRVMVRPAIARPARSRRSSPLERLTGRFPRSSAVNALPSSGRRTGRTARGSRPRIALGDVGFGFCLDRPARYGNQELRPVRRGRRGQRAPAVAKFPVEPNSPSCNDIEAVARRSGRVRRCGAGCLLPSPC